MPSRSPWSEVLARGSSWSTSSRPTTGSPVTTACTRSVDTYWRWPVSAQRHATAIWWLPGRRPASRGSATFTRRPPASLTTSDVRGAQPLDPDARHRNSHDEGKRAIDHPLGPPVIDDAVQRGATGGPHRRGRQDHDRKRPLGGEPVALVAAGVGFYDQGHFTRQFKRHVGTPPGRYALSANGPAGRQ